MNILIHDDEATMFKYDGEIHPKDRRGSPYSTRNRLVAIGNKWLGKPTEMYYNPTEKDIQSTIETFKAADLIVGFNLKYDLSWMMLHGVDFSNKKLWDIQIAEFLFLSQTKKYPSLNSTLERYGLPPKLDVIEEEYWSKGIDTDLIPKGILLKYLDIDCIRTEEAFLIQKEFFKGEHKGKYKLFQLQCEDLKVLQEMEYNGLRFNSKAARAEATDIRQQMESLKGRICELVGIPSDIPFNLNSNDHLSAILYGGSINWITKVADGVYKSGKKVGQIKYRNQEVSQQFDRLVEPLDKTETKKSLKFREEGDYIYPMQATSWSVAEDVLKQLKARGKAKEVIGAVLEYSKLEKLTNTYLEGFSDLIEEKNWPEDMIHGNLNQCSVVTGRLSSTSPNLQNIDPYTKKFLETRYT